MIKTGLLTIGPRFGGAVDDAARYFKDAYDRVSQWFYLATCSVSKRYKAKCLKNLFSYRF